MSRFLMIRHVAPLAFAAGMLAGCSSDSSTDPNGPGDSVPCTITMTGARSQPLACSGLTAGQTDGDTKSLFGLQGSGTTDTLGIAVGLTGAPVVKTYTNGIDAYPSVFLSTPIGGWTTGSDAGSLSLTFTSVKLKDSGAGLTTYEVHGTLTMRLDEEVSQGSSGPVSVTVKF